MGPSQNQGRRRRRAEAGWLPWAGGEMGQGALRSARMCGRSGAEPPLWNSPAAGHGRPPSQPCWPQGPGPRWLREGRRWHQPGPRRLVCAASRLLGPGPGAHACAAGWRPLARPGDPAAGAAGPDGRCRQLPHSHCAYHSHSHCVCRQLPHSHSHCHWSYRCRWACNPHCPCLSGNPCIGHDHDCSHCVCPSHTPCVCQPHSHCLRSSHCHSYRRRQFKNSPHRHADPAAAAEQ